MPGPPPKDPSLLSRRSKRITIATRLPADGRKGRIPPWPLVDDVVLQAKRDVAAARLDAARLDLEELRGTEKESTVEAKVWRLEETVAVLDATLRVQRDIEARMWKDLWRTPAATKFDLKWTHDLALMVRTGVLAQLGDDKARAEWRLQMAKYGLDPTSLLRLRWQIVPADEVPGAKTPSVPSAQQRYAGLRVVGTSAMPAEVRAPDD